MPVKMPSRATVGLSFAAGLVGGAVTQSLVFRIKDRRRLLIEYKERHLDECTLKRSKEILRFGLPRSSPEISYFANHVLNYNQERKIPNWVAEHLTKDYIQGDAHRKQCKFRRDPDVPDMFSAFNSDYLGSGWSRGHMAPAGDCKYNQKAMEDTFYLSNILPQNYENNGGFWNRMEIFCRTLTETYPNVYVISGPVMIPGKEESGKKFIRHYLIGNNNVAVPTHLYKVIVIDTGDKERPQALGAFVVPNKPISSEKMLKEFQVPLEDIEKLTGLTFVPDLDTDSTGDLCEVTGCQLMEWKKFELFMTWRKLQSANTINRLDTVWAEMKKKKIVPDQKVRETYKAKKAELEQKQDQTKSGVE